LKRQGFVAEQKFDGTRCLIIKEKGEVTLQNRHGIDYTVRLPEIVKAAKIIEGDFILDGEAVWINPKTGKEEFTPSQRRCSTQIPDYMFRQKYPITFMAFDILNLKGEDITHKPYWRRKRILKDLIEGSRLRYVPYRRDLEEAWKEVVKHEREGLIIKDFNSRYMFNERSWSWLKIKNWRFEECEVVGWTPGKNSRAPFFGSLVLAQNGKFRGCVGSGFNDWELYRIRNILRDSPKTEKPFPDGVVGEPYTPVKTGLRVLIKYYETTSSGVMRHPVFIRTL